MGDLTAGRLREVAAMGAAGVCAICEEELGNGEPVELGLPYHVECLREAIEDAR